MMCIICCGVSIILFILGAILYMISQQEIYSLNNFITETTSKPAKFIAIKPETTISNKLSIEESAGWFDVPNDVWEEIKAAHYMTRNNYVIAKFFVKLYKVKNKKEFTVI